MREEREVLRAEAARERGAVLARAEEETRLRVRCELESTLAAIRAWNSEKESGVWVWREWKPADPESIGSICAASRIELLYL